jgi:hypothetical protein
MAKKNIVGIFDHPKTKKALWILLLCLCVLSVLLEVPLHRHSHFSDNGVDGYFAFYAVMGFLACTISILIAKFVGLFLMKKGNYYDRDIT